MTNTHNYCNSLIICDFICTQSYRFNIIFPIEDNSCTFSEGYGKLENRKHLVNAWALASELQCTKADGPYFMSVSMGGHSPNYVLTFLHCLPLRDSGLLQGYI